MCSLCRVWRCPVAVWYGAGRSRCRSLFYRVPYGSCLGHLCMFFILLFPGFQWSFLQVLIVPSYVVCCVLWYGYMFDLGGFVHIINVNLFFSFSHLLIRSSGRYWLSRMCFPSLTALDSILMLQRQRFSACPSPPPTVPFLSLSVTRFISNMTIRTLRSPRIQNPAELEGSFISSC